jgi:hypothetical protein
MKATTTRRLRTIYDKKYCGQSLPQNTIDLKSLNSRRTFAKRVYCTNQKTTQRLFVRFKAVAVRGDSSYCSECVVSLSVYANNQLLSRSEIDILQHVERLATRPNEPV